MWRDLEWTWFEKATLHVAGVLGLLMLPINGPIAIGVIIWMYVKGERYMAKRCSGFVLGLVSFMFNHDIDRLMDVYDKYDYNI